MKKKSDCHVDDIHTLYTAITDQFLYGTQTSIKTLSQKYQNEGKEAVADILREMSDNNSFLENLLVEYGIYCFLHDFENNVLYFKKRDYEQTNNN